MRHELTARVRRRGRRVARRRVLVGVVALALFGAGGAFGFGELALRPAVEGRIATAVADEFSLARQPTVRVRGFPLVVDVARQQLEGVDLDISGETFEGLRIERVAVRTGRVSFGAGDLMRGSGVVRIDDGRGEAVVTAADLTDYLNRQGLRARVELGGGMAQVSGDIELVGMNAPVTVRGVPAIRDQVLQFAPTQFDLGALAGVPAAASVAAAKLAFTAPLPDLEGIRLGRLTISDGRVDVEATFDAIELAY